MTKMRFNLLVYDDPLYVTPVKNYSIEVYSVDCYKVSTHVGQKTPLDIILEPDGIRRQCSVFSNANNILVLNRKYSQPFRPFLQQPTEIGSIIESYTPGTTHCQVHIVDGETKEIVHIARICIETIVPKTTRKFEFSLSIN